MAKQIPRVVSKIARATPVAAAKPVTARLSKTVAADKPAASATAFSNLARSRGISYFMVSYTDLMGVQRAKLVPTAAIDQMARDGAGFAGFATWLDMTPADPDLFAVPDFASVIQLPWKREVAWVAADLIMAGQPVEQAPRQVLRRQIAAAKKLGFTVKTGVECEFFLITPDGDQISDSKDRQGKPCYDQLALMRRFDLISRMCDHMQSLGWGAYQNDHEDANGQFEMNWSYADALTTADRHAFFKYMAKSLAEDAGLRATFMPKPFARMSGNGCHCHVSFWDAEGRNAFIDRPSAGRSKGELGLSAIAYQVIAGLMQHADALCAITNSTVNSYKRINAPVTSSGATWSPNAISYTGNNRTHMVRIPEGNRFEFRLPDGAVNPYLLPAALIAAGLDGIAHQRDPGPRRDNNMYTDQLPEGTARRLPANLLDALRNLQASTTLTASLGADFVRAFLKLKHQEWNEAHAQISEWERAATLDC